jgi:two-component system, NtrC family, sensor kinase
MPCSPDLALPGAIAAVLANLDEAGLSRHIQLTVSDAGGRILYATQAYCAALGYSTDEVVGRDYRMFASGEHPEGFFRAMWDTLQRGRDWRGEVCNRRKDGQAIWMALTVFRLPVPAGQDTCFVTLSADITERCQAEAEHRKLEGVLSQFLQGDPVPTFVIDEHHVITHWNRALEAITGLPAARMVGSSQAGRVFYGEDRPVMADLIVDGHFEELEHWYHEHYRPSRVVPDAYEGEGYFPHLGGSGRWLSFTAAPLRDESGRIIGAIETLVDITERKEAEEILKRSQIELEVLVDKRTAQLAQAKAELEADVIKRQQSESELRRRNAELTDLNERLNAAQNQLAQSERLASIGQLAAGVAHEINNPIGYVQSNLGALDGYLNDLFELIDGFEHALDALPADHPAAQAARALKQRKELDYLREDVPSLLTESKEGIARVRKIVADLKDFSRVDTSQEWQFANLHQGIESTLNIVNNEIKYKADVVREYGQLPEVECLPSQLNQVFMNLLVNAAHAIERERGCIRVRTGAGDEQVWVEVADNGSGIAAEHLSRIFDPFFTTKAVGKGTGLGLSLSYGIVQKHGGSIEVSSQVGEGTTFRITLPIRQTSKDSVS